jgi:NDP-sugar pyrophosphorylase family protein
LSSAYWLDLGTPEQYLQAHFDILDGKVSGEPPYPAPFVAEGASVDLRAHLGRWVVVGAGARIGADAELDDSVLHAGAVVETRARVLGSVLGPRSRVGAGATVVGSTLAEGARVAAGAIVEDARVSADEEVGRA